MNVEEIVSRLEKTGEPFERLLLFAETAARSAELVMENERLKTKIERMKEAAMNKHDEDEYELKTELMHFVGEVIQCWKREGRETAGLEHRLATLKMELGR